MPVWLPPSYLSLRSLVLMGIWQGPGGIEVEAVVFDDGPLPAGHPAYRRRADSDGLLRGRARG